MKRSILISAAVLVLALTFACTKEKTEPTNDPPADHTISKDGYMHKTGLNDPLNNCTACHGVDLTGGTAGVSCFQCHGTKW